MVLSTKMWLEYVDAGVHNKIIYNKLKEMPRGKGRWPNRFVTDILGVCIHQTASSNTTKPINVGMYHTGPNHLSHEGLPSICYDFCITDSDTPTWLTADITKTKYAQGNKEMPGYENRALIAIAVLGAFKAPGIQGDYLSNAPSSKQMKKLNELVLWLQDFFKFENSAIFGHYDFGKASCPGYALTSWIEEKRSGSNKLETIKEWQKALVAWNSNALARSGIDGIFGNETRQWLSLFQKANRLEITGYPDAFTNLKLYKILYPNGRKDVCIKCKSELIDGLCVNCDL